MKYFYYTLGCKVNQYETEVLKKLFGGEVTYDAETADIIVVNSCTVTAESDRKTRQAVRRFKKQSPDSVVVLTGCFAQSSPEKAGAIAEADIVAGNRLLSEIPQLVEEFIKNKKPIRKHLKHKQGDCYSTPIINDFGERTRAFLKIEDGCERYCSYCVIPYARGFVRSKSLEDIKRETENLSQKGFTEIVLVGINLSAYGKGEEFNLCDAVSTVAGVKGIKRVRLGSLEPDHISDEMLKRFKACEKFCPQFHLSLQSGSSATLKRMNRHYDSAFYRDLVSRIRNQFDGAAITTDIMVGFAGETEEEFSESLSFAKEIGFSKAHVFQYSVREGTVAAKMKPQVPESIKAERSRLMIAATSQSEKAFLNAHIGKTAEVLFETKENGFWAGHTANYCHVLLKSEKALNNQILKVKFTAVEGDNLIGILV